MKIKLKNIGTLKQAEIDLSKDLIVLAGPNNTGKTYAAYTVYGICEAIKNISFVEPNDELANAVILIVSQFFKNNESTEKITVLNFFEQFEKAIKATFNKNGHKTLLNNVFADHGNHFKESELDLILDKNKIVQYLIDIKVEVSYVGSNIVKVNKAEKEDTFDLYIFNPEDKKNIIPYLQWAYKMLASSATEAYFKNIYINTAERSAINIFSKELSIKRNNIVDQLLELRDTKGDANQLLGKLQRYPLPIRDSLVIAEDLANLSRNKSEFSFLADRIEEVLLDGKINISKDGEVQYSPNKSKVKNLSIHLTASIVKSLSNLVFYFRHLAQKGDFIIIDEPELNLHPDNQRKIARLFGEIINQGFKVMISTHSDYVIREINNLVMLKSGGGKATDLIKKYGYEEKQLIDHQRVGAYLFKNNRNYDIEVTETGFEVDTIDEEINNLNNASEDIYFTLFD